VVFPASLVQRRQRALIGGVQDVIRIMRREEPIEEIFITPLTYAWAMMMKTAPETATAQMTGVTNTVLLRGTQRPKLAKRAVS
jgi:hypothetical protein